MLKVPELISTESKMVFRNVEQLKSDILYFQAAFNESYDANEFFMQDIYNITLLLAEEIAFRYDYHASPHFILSI